MAFMEVNFFSDALGMCMSMYVIVPQKTRGNIGVTEGEFDSTYPTLYLLHGMSDDHTIWMRRTSIERYAEARGIAVVMPTTYLGWYTDMKYGYNYRTFIGEELPKICRSFFPNMSKKREDTYIAGLSMGGYGAWYIGLSHPDRFAAAASLSGAVDVAFRATPIPQGQAMALPRWMLDCFGDVQTLPGSDRDVFTLAEKAKQAGCLPRLYQSCGTADFLYGMNLCSYRKLTEMEIPVTWREIPGKAHEWDLWDEEIRNVIDWMLK